jgi:hypothetical protein
MSPEVPVRFGKASGCPDGETGRRKGLKIPRASPVPVRVRLRAPNLEAMGDRVKDPCGACRQIDQGHVLDNFKIMIVYDLVCVLGHRFEGWFPSAKAFVSQKEKGLVSCPVCGDSSDIERLPSSPYINTKTADKETADKAGAASGLPEKPLRPAEVLGAALSRILDQYEDVGKRFPEEARRIHYGEAPPRNIRGSARREEAEALAEEGIPVVQIPIPSPGDLH